MTLKALGLILSDVALAIMMICFSWVALVAWKVRRNDGIAASRYFQMMLGEWFFFVVFTIVYLDRRFNLVPGMDLLGYEWYWIFRLIVVVVIVRFWLVVPWRNKK